MNLTGIRLSDDQRRDWLRLIRSQNIGPQTFFKLINRYGSATAALEALPTLTRSVRGQPITLASEREVDTELALARKLGVRFIAFGEAEYPSALRAIDSPPPLIAVSGQVSAFQKPMLGIVGARNASASGRAFTHKVAQMLSEAGYTIVSGLARGVDASAHEASLQGGTIGVLAGGHNRLYPPEHHDLARAMIEQGAIVSEMPVDWEPRGRDFPRRNRIISGLSIGVLVVEASDKSGSLITATYALEQGREVMAVPGSPMDPRNAGTNKLLKDGATLVTSAQDVFETLERLRNATSEPDQWAEMPMNRQPSLPLWEEMTDLFPDLPSPPVGPDDANGWEYELAEPDASEPFTPSARVIEPMELLSLLSATPAALDDLIRMSQLSARDVHLTLFELEAEGHIERLPGNLIVRKAS